ncbi:hypothetical protein FIBSPDRAFT_936390 [Athelia psychrophila]|uniref:Uncharacterized protein n=1 Tax=Athelia psychrophila TaxID=1759441 RepID=A0A166C6C1_9AGAM|nr:hypothetical protein FIBSPDRAFT_936390 [Fibularhizoctonia sp. CBS 109695]
MALENKYDIRQNTYYPHLIGGDYEDTRKCKITDSDDHVWNGDERLLSGGRWRDIGGGGKQLGDPEDLDRDPREPRSRRNPLILDPAQNRDLDAQPAYVATRTHTMSAQIFASASVLILGIGGHGVSDFKHHKLGEEIIMVYDMVGWSRGKGPIQPVSKGYHGAREICVTKRDRSATRFVYLGSNRCPAKTKQNLVTPTTQQDSAFRSNQFATHLGLSLVQPDSSCLPRLAPLDLVSSEPTYISCKNWSKEALNNLMLWRPLCRRSTVNVIDNISLHFYAISKSLEEGWMSLRTQIMRGGERTGREYRQTTKVAAGSQKSAARAGPVACSAVPGGGEIQMCERTTGGPGEHTGEPLRSHIADGEMKPAHQTTMILDGNIHAISHPTPLR